MEKYEVVHEFLDDLSDDDILYLWDEYARENRYQEDYLFCMYELDDYFCGCSAGDVLDRICFGSFDNHDRYFFEGIYGIESTDDVFTKVDVDTLADYIADRDEAFGNRDLRDVLDDWAEEHEDE